MTTDLPTPILVTGASGFLGSRLLAALRDVNGLVVTFGRRKPLENLGRTHWFGDVAERRELAEAINEVRPRLVFHLAGQTSHADPREYYHANVRGADSLLHALRERPAQVVSVGSAAELGAVAAEDLPAAESLSCKPIDAYALSKWFATRLTLQAKPPLEPIVARLFNLNGPGAPNSQALGRFAELLAAPLPDPLRLIVGNLVVKRDFLDVRDAAAALLALAANGRSNTLYHVGSGESRRIGDGLNELIRLSG